MSIDVQTRLPTLDKATHAEDFPHVSSTDYGSFVLGVRNDTITNILTSTDGDYSPFAVSSQGHIFSKLVANDSGSPVLLSANSSGNLIVKLTTDSPGLYAEDDPFVDGSLGNFILAVRNDNSFFPGTPFTTANGDLSPIAVDQYGRLKLDTSYQPFTDPWITTTWGQQVLGFCQYDGVTFETDAAIVPPGNFTPFVTDSLSHLKCTLRSDYVVDAPYTNPDADSNPTGGQLVLAIRNDVLGSLVTTDLDFSPLQVDSAGALRVSFTGVGSGQYAEDSVHTSTDIGNFTLAVRNDANTSLVDTDGDYAPLQVNSIGALKVSLVSIPPPPPPPGANVISYATETVANGASSATLTYTCINTTFTLNSIIASASSGPCKVEIIVNAITYAVAFFSSANPLVQIAFSPNPTMTTGQIAEIRVTNSSGLSQDVYGTLMGQDV